MDEETYDEISTTSGSLCEASGGAYASKLMPGYTTRGVLGIEGICLLNTPTVKFEFARMVSACSAMLNQEGYLNATSKAHSWLLPPKDPWAVCICALERCPSSFVPRRMRHLPEACRGSGNRTRHVYAQTRARTVCKLRAGPQRRHHTMVRQVAAGGR